MNRRESSKIETRGLILEAARDLFNEKGMDECTMRDIAARAGVSAASVVVHFRSKTALLEEALAGDIEDALSGLMASMPKGPGLLARFMHLSTGMFRFYDRNRDLYRVLIRSTIFEPSEETPRMTGQAGQYMEFIAAMAEEERARGVMSREADPVMVAAFLFSLYLGALTTLFRTPAMTVEAVSEWLASVAALCLKGLARTDL